MSANPQEKLIPIGELAARTGVSRRTVRFYIQRGLIDPPVGRGRGSGYTAAHVDQVLRVRRLQREGLGLGTIRGLAGRAEEGALPAPAVRTVSRLELGPGLRLEVDTPGVLPDPRVLAALAQACRRILAGEGDQDMKKGEDHGQF